MKPVIARVMLLMGSLLSSAIVIADCNNPDIAITKPDSRYTDHVDGTVTDKQTGLMWRKCSLGLSGNKCTEGTAVTLTWQAALAAANENTDLGYFDWRLPNKNELVSLLEHACVNPAINTSVFPNTVTTSFYWSSSPHAGNNNNAWSANFNNGSVNIDVKSGARYVRLVRGSQ